MQAIRKIEHLTGNQLILDLPASFRGKQVEIIVLELAATDNLDTYATTNVRRKPAAALAGKMTLQDDLIDSAVPASDWENS